PGASGPAGARALMATWTSARSAGLDPAAVAGLLPYRHQQADDRAAFVEERQDEPGVVVAGVAEAATDAMQAGDAGQAHGIVVAQGGIGIDRDRECARLLVSAQGNRIARQLEAELAGIGIGDIDDVELADDAGAHEVDRVDVGELATGLGAQAAPILVEV